MSKIFKAIKCIRCKDPVLYKKSSKLNEIFGNRVECQTVEELLNLKRNTEALHYESLLIR